MPAPNRRRSPRAVCQLEGKVLGPRGTLRGTIRNLSAGGLFFECKDLLPVGQGGDFEFRVEGQLVRLAGEVRYHHPLEGGLTAMGVRFIRLEPAALALIQRFIQAAPQANEPPTP